MNLPLIIHMYRIIIYVILIILLALFGFSKITSSTEGVELVHKVEASSQPKIEVDPLFEKIAYCESKNDPHAKNPSSSASGRFQFLWSSWNYYGKMLWGENFYEKNVFNYNDNTELAKYVYELNGTKDWDASRDCWAN